MHFVDQIDLVSAPRGGVLNVVQQLAGILDLRSRRRIHFDQVDEAAFCNLSARITLATGLGANAHLAIEAFREDARDGGLADTSCASEQIRMMQTLVVQRVNESLEHMLLPCHVLEGLGTPLAR